MGGEGSGRVVTPEDRARRSAAGKRSAEVRRAKAGKLAAHRPMEDAEISASTQDEAASAGAHESKTPLKLTEIRGLPEKSVNFTADASLASLGDYDDLLGRPTTWTDAKRREEVQGEILLNEARRVEGEVRRGKLFTWEQVEGKFAAYDEAVMGELAAVVELVASVAEPAKKNDARAHAREWLTALRLRVTEIIEAIQGSK